MGSQTETIWRATYKQSLFISCPCFEVFFGGARGGAKTDGVLGDWAAHSNKYGEHAIGLLVRRELTQLRELIERSKRMYGPLGAQYSEADKMWRMPGGARLNLSYLEHDEDADRHQGSSFCVAVGTAIRMADGSSKPIEQIIAGEMVATLEGPRRVLSAVSPYVAPSVRVLVRDGNGEVLGEQTHPIWHSVLTTAGLTLKRKHQTRHIGWQSPAGSISPCIGGEESPSGIGLNTPAWFAWSEGGQISCKERRPNTSRSRRPRQRSVPVVLHEPSSRSSSIRGLGSPRVPTQFHFPLTLPQATSGLFRWLRKTGSLLRWDLEPLCGLLQSTLGSFDLSHSNELSCACGGSRKALGSQEYYSGGFYLRGEPVRASSKSARDGIPSPAYAGGLSRGEPPGELGTIPTHSHLGSLSWVHPYSGEERHLSESVTKGTMEFVRFERSLVADLCVESANHYISADTGLINKNTRIYVEELGNFPNKDPIFKLMATLRSAHGVPVGFRATGNPGGVGQSWIKQRYIDPAPAGMKRLVAEFKNPFTGQMMERDRVFIPSNVTDNPHLPPDYVANLQLVGNEKLVKAWLTGDWSQVEGAYFDNFDVFRHVVRPFSISPRWLRFRAMDWGSAKPFAVGWFMVAGDDLYLDPATQDGRRIMIPRGALVMFREWYGCRKDGNGDPIYNVGLKMDAEDVGAGIVALEAEGAPSYSVLDPSAFHRDGGPSIAERMGDAGAYFERAINTRTDTENGRAGGWNLVRHRLNGELGRPMLFFFNTCTHTIRTLPEQQHDPKKPEDIDTEGEDHAADMVRYGCASRPWVKKHPVDFETEYAQSAEMASKGYMSDIRSGTDGGIVVNMGKLFERQERRKTARSWRI